MTKELSLDDILLELSKPLEDLQKEAGLTQLEAESKFKEGLPIPASVTDVTESTKEAVSVIHTFEEDKKSKEEASLLEELALHNYMNIIDLKGKLKKKYDIDLDDKDIRFDNVNGKIAGSITLHESVDRNVPFIGLNIIKSMAGNIIYDTKDCIFDGKILSGKLKLRDDDWYKFEGENLTEIIPNPRSGGFKIYDDWKILNHILDKKYNIEIVNADYEHANPSGGNIFGKATLSDGRKVPFFGDDLYKSFGPMDVNDCSEIMLFAGELNCQVLLDDGNWYKFDGTGLDTSSLTIHKTVVKSLENQVFGTITDLDMRNSPGFDSYYGIATVNSNKKIPFVGDTIFSGVASDCIILETNSLEYLKDGNYFTGEVENILHDIVKFEIRQDNSGDFKISKK